MSEPTKPKSTRRMVTAGAMASRARHPAHEAVKPHPHEDFQARVGDNRVPVGAGRGRRRGGSDYRGSDHTAHAPSEHPSARGAARAPGSHHLGRPSGWESGKLDKFLDLLDR